MKELYKLNPWLELRVCMDCLMWHANAEHHPDNTEAEDQAIEAGFSRWEAQGNLSLGDREEDSEFGTEPCGVCWSHLYGSRHQIFFNAHPLKEGTQ